MSEEKKPARIASQSDAGGEEIKKEEPTKEIKKESANASAKAAEGEKKDEKKEVKIPAKFKDLVKQIEELTVLELSELVKVLEEKFGVSAAAPVAMAAAGSAQGAGAGDAGAAEEKSEFDVELKAAGDSKISVIKIVREITGKGLKEAKDMVDGAPKVIKEKASKKEAEELKKKLEEAGATVELK